MSFRDMLVCLDGTVAGEGRLKLAARLASEHRAHLVGVYPVPDDGEKAVFQTRETLAANRGGDVGLLERSVAATVPPSVERAEQLEQRFRDELRLHGLDGDWHLIDGPDTAELLALAKSFDLTIAGQFSRDPSSRPAFRPDEIAVAAGRPVLIVPYAGQFKSVGEHVLIAWDGTREATRALNDALPLMTQAKTVTVITVFAQQSEFERAHAGLQRTVHHLERHGVAARAEESLRGDLAISDVLLSRAADLGADLLVAGAYHHSPLREALLGGVSRELLQHMTVPLLMSH